MKYWDEKFYMTYQRGIGWPDDYIGPDSMTQWIIEISVGFTDIGLLRISESVRAYAYLILSSHPHINCRAAALLRKSCTKAAKFFNISKE